MTIPEETLDLLKTFYIKEGCEPARLVQIGLKSGWTTIVGTGKLCGTAFRFSGSHNVYQLTKPDIKALDTLTGQSLMDIAAKYISSDFIQKKSIAVAAMSALSQPFLTVESLAQRGFLVGPDGDCMREVLKPDDIVTFIWYGGMIQNILGRCKELHIADMRPLQLLPAMLIKEDIKYELSLLLFMGPTKMNLCSTAPMPPSLLPPALSTTPLMI